MASPENLRIPLDEDRFPLVGRLPDGTQFLAFVTGAMLDDMVYPASSEEYSRHKQWLAVLHRFDADGNHIGSEERLGGYDSEERFDASDEAEDRLWEMYADMVTQGEPEFCDIRVKLFSVQLDGVTHGLFYEPPEDEHGKYDPELECVMLEPCDIMFHPPWDSSEYST